MNSMTSTGHVRVEDIAQYLSISLSSAYRLVRKHYPPRINGRFVLTREWLPKLEWSFRYGGAHGSVSSRHFLASLANLNVAPPSEIMLYGLSYRVVGVEGGYAIRCEIPAEGVLETAPYPDRALAEGVLTLHLLSVFGEGQTQELADAELYDTPRDTKPNCVDALARAAFHLVPALEWREVR